MTAASTLLLLVRHGETPTTGTVLPGRAPACTCPAGAGSRGQVAERLAVLPVVSAISFTDAKAPAVLTVNSTSEPLSNLRVP